MQSYKLLTDSKTGTFELIIESYINDGWELYGPTFFTDRRFAQAIIKTVKVRTKKSAPQEEKAA